MNFSPTTSQKKPARQQYFDDVSDQIHSNNLLLPSIFQDNVTLKDLVSTKRIHRDDLLANLVYPNKMIVDQALTRKKLGNQLEQEFRNFADLQSQLVEDLNYNRSDLSHQIFRVLAASLKLDCTLCTDNIFNYDIVIRSIDLNETNLFTYYWIWKLCNQNMNQLTNLEVAVKNILRLMRPTATLEYWPPMFSVEDTDFTMFKDWFISKINDVIAESNIIKHRIVPRSSITDKSSKLDLREYTQFIKTLYLEVLKDEITQIVNSDTLKIDQIFEKLTLTIPCCELIKAREYIHCKNFDTTKTCVSGGIIAAPIQIHINDFFLTLFSLRSLNQTWGHEKGQKIRIVNKEEDIAARLKISASKTKIWVKNFDEIISSFKETDTKLIEYAQIMKSCTNTNPYFQVGEERSYRITSCHGNCAKLTITCTPLIATNTKQLIELSSQWTKLIDVQKKCVFDLWESLSLNILSNSFIKNVRKLISFDKKSKNEKMHAVKFFQFDISDNDINRELLKPIFSIYPANENDPDMMIAFCFVLDKFMKIFNVFCSDPKKYQTTVVIEESFKKLAEMVIQTTRNKLTDKSNSYHDLRSHLKFVIDIKLKEISQYFKNLKKNDAELDLSFEDKPAIIIDNRKKDKFQPRSAYLFSHEYGFSYLSQDSLNNQNLKTRLYSLCDNNNFINMNTFFKFIADCWDKGEFLIPIMQEKKSSQTDARKRKLTLMEALKDKKNSGGTRLRHKKLGLSKNALSSEIQSFATTVQIDKETKKKKNEVETLSAIHETLFGLPDYMLKIQMQSSNNIFCAIASDSMVNVYIEISEELYNNQLNSPTLQLFDVPNDESLEIEDKHRKTILIDSLYDDQRETIARFEAWKLAGCGGIIADEPGLGKTRIACEILLRSLLEFPERPCLVIAPNLVKSQWVSEFWNAVCDSAKKLARKASDSTNPSHRTQGFWLQTCIDNGQKKFYLSTKIIKPVLSEEEVKRLDAYCTFFKTFSEKDIHLITEPKQFEKLIETSKTGSLKGILITQLSYFDTQFDFNNLDKFSKINPSVVVVDEAHQLLSQSEDPKKISKTIKLDYIFRGFACSKVLLTATPLVNELNDLVDLLMISTNNERKFQAADHFENELYRLADKLLDIKNSMDSKDSDSEDESSSNYVEMISSLANRCLMTFMWLKEKIINPRIARTTREARDMILESNGTGLASNIDIRKFSFDVKATQEQNTIHDEIFEKHNKSFFKFTNLVSALLIHPDLCDATETQIKNKITQINKMNTQELDDYIKRSSLLNQLFLESGIEDKNKTIADIIKDNQRAIIFVSKKVHATFLQAIAKKKFNLKDNEIYAVHSGNPNGLSEVEQFKQLKTKGILFLLPGTGGAGLSFTNVALNLLLTVGWTHKDKEQCGGRNTRGSGIKYIGSPEYPFSSAIHVKNIVKKKECLSDLFLDMTEFSQDSLTSWMDKILNGAGSIIMAQMGQTKAVNNNKNWNLCFSLIKQGIGAQISDGRKLWEDYQTLKLQLQNNKDDQSEANFIEDNSNLMNKKRRVDNDLSHQEIKSYNINQITINLYNDSNTSNFNTNSNIPSMMNNNSKTNPNIVINQNVFINPGMPSNQNTQMNQFPQMASNYGANQNQGIYSNTSINQNRGPYQNTQMNQFPQMASNYGANQNQGIYSNTSINQNRGPYQNTQMNQFPQMASNYGANQNQGIYSNTSMNQNRGPYQNTPINQFPQLSTNYGSSQNQGMYQNMPMNQFSPMAPNYGASQNQGIYSSNVGINQNLVMDNQPRDNSLISTNLKAEEKLEVEEIDFFL